MSTKKVIVEVRNGDINRALKLFKRKSMDSGHLQEYRDRKEYIKPTTARRKKKLKAIRMNLLNLQSQEQEI